MSVTGIANILKLQSNIKLIPTKPKTEFCLYFTGNTTRKSYPNIKSVEEGNTFFQCLYFKSDKRQQFKVAIHPRHAFDILSSNVYRILYCPFLNILKMTYNQIHSSIAVSNQNLEAT